MNIDREGIFKARPLQWRVKVFDGSLSVAIAIEFAIVAQLADNEWQDWSGYDEHRVWGDWWVVKKDGKPNVSAVEQLRDARK